MSLTKQLRAHHLPLSATPAHTTYTNDKYQESEETITFWDTEITEHTPVKPEEPRIYIRDSVFALAGEISIISGVPKVGKSAVCAPMLATCFATGYDAAAALHIRTTPANGANVVYIDTEQSAGRTVGFINKVCKRAGLAARPTNLRFFNWRELNHARRYEYLKQFFEQMTNLHLVVIDGLTDLVDSVNNENAGNEIINYLMKQSSRHNCSVVIIIHENRAGGNARGHIGAESERKCAGMISVKSDAATEIKEIQPKYLRASSNFAPVLFRWNDGIKDYALLTDADMVGDGYTKQGKKDELLKSLLKQAYGPSTELQEKDLKNNLALYKAGNNNTEAAKVAGRRAFKDALDAGFINQKDNTTTYLLTI